MDEIHLCKICNGRARMFKTLNLYEIICLNCHTPTSLYSTKKEAIEAWNTRKEEASNE